MGCVSAWFLIIPKLLFCFFNKLSDMITSCFNSSDEEFPSPIRFASINTLSYGYRPIVEKFSFFTDWIKLLCKLEWNNHPVKCFR